LVTPTWRARLANWWWVPLAILGYLLVVGWLVVLRYNGYHIWGVDLGQFDQGLWNTWQGRLLRFTQYGGLEDTLLTDHVEPIMLLIAPLYLIRPDPRALLLLQVLALGWGGWVVYKLALRHLTSSFAALCIALAYLVHPAIVGNGLDAGGSFRPDVLTIPLFLSALLALEEHRWARAVIWAVLAMACKEYIAAVVFMLGLYVVYRYRRPRLGLAMAAMGVAYLIIVLEVFLPWARGGQSSIHYQLNFGSLGGSGGPAGIFSTLVSQPQLLISRLLSQPYLLAVFFSLLSLALLPLGDLALLAVGLPILGIFTLAGVPSLFDFHLAPALPFFFAAAIRGIGRLGAWGYRQLGLSATRIAVSLSVLLLGASLSAAFFWSNGPLGWGFWTSVRPYTFWQNHFVVDEHDRRADRFVAKVPADEPVIASDFLLLRLTQRRQVYHFFDPPPQAILGQVNYAVIDLFETYIRPGEAGLRALIDLPSGSVPLGTTPPARVAGKELYRQLLSGGEFNLNAYEDGLLFLQRAAGEAHGFHYGISRVDQVNPSTRLGYNFGNRLRLIGYDFDGSSAVLTQGWRYRITYYWQVLDGFAAPFTFRYGVNPVDDVQQCFTDYLIVDTFQQTGRAPFRVVHLPTYLVLPPAEWKAGQLIREEYEFVLPQDLAEGPYEWQVGLYVVPPHYFPIVTSPERWVPGTAPFRMPDVQVVGVP